MQRPFKIALVTIDNRDEYRKYDLAQPYFGTAPTALMEGFAGMPEVEVHVVGCTQRTVVKPAQLAPNIFYHSEIVPKWGWLRGAYQGCVRSVRRQLKQIRPDIVHGQGTERYCSLAAVLSGYPRVLTIHGNMRLIARVNGAKPFSFQWLAARLERFTLPRANGIVCITNYTRLAVESLAQRTWVVPNAVDSAFFAVQPAPDPAAPPIVLCVGVICFRKNQNAFIRALDPLAAERPFKVVFLGEIEDSPYGAEFRELLKTRPWCEHVAFSGRDRVREHFRAASAIALPTQEDNCPMVVLEGMAAGVPVFASNVGGVPDLIEDGVTGLLCDPQRPETFRACLTRLLDDRAFAERLAAAGREHAKKHFHPLAVARRHLEIYREVTGRS